MLDYIIDLMIVAVLVVGITAVMGVLANGIGTKIFGGKSKNLYVEQSINMQTGWKQVGGTKNDL